MINLDNVSLKYKSEKDYTLKDISLTLEDNKIISIIGKNGTGKTSLVKLLSGIIQPTSGKITLDNIDTSSKKDFISLRKKVSVVFQNPENQIIFERVYEELEFTLKNLKFTEKEIEENIDSALKLVGMEDYKYKETSSLSLGQKQKIIIAEALAINSDILILDEPTAMLDPISKKQILSLFKVLKEKGKTIIFVTHTLEEIFYSDICLVLNNGKTLEVLNTTDILKDINLIKKINIDNSNFMFNLLEKIYDKKNKSIDFSKYNNEENFSDFLLKEIINNIG